MKDRPCNLCGLSCDLPFEGEPPDLELDDFGLIESTVMGHYLSTPGTGRIGGALDDTIRHRFSLCEFCLDWLFGQFQVPVEVSSYLPEGPADEPWRPAVQRVAHDDWRQDKEFFFAEYERRNAARQRKRETGGN